MNALTSTKHRRRDDIAKKNIDLDKIAINTLSHRLQEKLLTENPKLEEIMRLAKNETEALVGVKEWILEYMENRPEALDYYKSEHSGPKIFKRLIWQDYAAIRLLDYIDNAGRTFIDPNLRGEIALSNPLKLIWLAVNHGTGGAKPFFFEDMIQLFRQFSGKQTRKLPGKKIVKQWMERYPSGLDPRIIKLREENRERILKVIIGKIDKGELNDAKYKFTKSMSNEQKFLMAVEWWKESSFHLKFAARNPDLLNEMLGYSLDPDTMKILYSAEKAGIPFFVNPYYLSLLHVRTPYFAIGADQAIRNYILYSPQLINEFGHIVAWEKEDIVKPGEPNVAGWLLPTDHNIHRRYPDVAILIPDTMGRACGGLCASCQRMYNFQRGLLNFNLDKLKPDTNWAERLESLMEYFEKDSQLRDILITGGDALMSSDNSLEKILAAILEMAERKKEANKKRKDGEKYAEITRVRIGSRLLQYLPMRVNDDLVSILADFVKKGSKLGISQFMIQTHYESPMEVTPESQTAVERLIKAGWTITNQHVLTAASSRRGHTAKLRQILGELGVLPYYTFTVKGYMENYNNFATNARAMQEQIEEKTIGRIPKKYYSALKDFSLKSRKIAENIEHLRKTANIPFVATDRNVLNLPGVGKSLTFRVIGITRYGRRILEFDHDPTRAHSPIIHKMGKVVIIESKSIAEYLKQLEEMGEDTDEYESLYGYSVGETEARLPVYDYPDYPFKITPEMTNLQIDN
jgi:lysine 2,3-aminomutase